MTNFWLSGAGGGFEENLQMRTAVVDWSVRGQIRDQEESRQGGPGAMNALLGSCMDGSKVLLL